MQKWNDTQEGVKFPIKWDQSYQGVCCVRRKSPIAAVAQDFIPREEIRRGGSYLVFQLIFLPTLEEAHALGVRGMLNTVEGPSQIMRNECQKVRRESTIRGPMMDA